MELKIDSIELADPAFQVIVDELARSIKVAQDLAVIREELPRYMTKKQASEYAGCSFNTFQKFIRRGLKVIYVDNVIRIDKHDIDSFLEANKK